MENLRGLESEYSTPRYDTPSGSPSILSEVLSTQGLVAALRDAINELEEALRSALIPVDSSESPPDKAESPGPPVSDLYNNVLENNLHLSDQIRYIQRLTKRINL